MNNHLVSKADLIRLEQRLSRRFLLISGATLVLAVILACLPWGVILSSSHYSALAAAALFNLCVIGVAFYGESTHPG